MKVKRVFFAPIGAVFPKYDKVSLNCSSPVQTAELKSAQMSGFFYAPILKDPVYFEHVKTNLPFAWAFTVGLYFP